MHRSTEQPFPSSQSRSLPQRGRSVVVVVAGAAQLAAAQASQQLDAVPAQALPPGGALHGCPPLLTLQRLPPSARVRQQVTSPGRPQVERAAQRTTAVRHWGRSVPRRAAVLATRTTQAT